MIGTKPDISHVMQVNAGGIVSPGLIKALSAAALEEEVGEQSITASIDLLRQAGLLDDDGSRDPIGTAQSLMYVGAANLSVGRLYEGHINALLLIALYGASSIKNDVCQKISGGAFLGVWGADGQDPVIWEHGSGELVGSKTFASGLGTVTHAIVTVNSGSQVRLALIDVRDMTRADVAAWDMLGMKATASGNYNFTGLREEDFAWFGEAGDYATEPHFVGGVWRIAALQAGATIGLLDRAATQLRDIGRMDAEPQKARLMMVLARAWAGASLAERAASATVNSDLEAEQVVSASIVARLFTEEVGLDAIRAVEQSLGLQHFRAGSDTGRMARDLSVYLRQAARDVFLSRAADAAFGQDDQVWGIFA